MSDDDKPVKKTLPITWKGAEGAAAKAHVPIVAPNGQELAVYSNQRQTTCGECRDFRHKAAQQLMPEFLKKLVHEYEWKIAHLTMDPKTGGRCLQDETLLVGPHSKGCELFKRK